MHGAAQNYTQLSEYIINTLVKPHCALTSGAQLRLVTCMTEDGWVPALRVFVHMMWDPDQISWLNTVLHIMTRHPTKSPCVEQKP